MYAIGSSIISWINTYHCLFTSIPIILTTTNTAPIAVKKKRVLTPQSNGKHKQQSDSDRPNIICSDCDLEFLSLLEDFFNCGEPKLSPGGFS